MCKFPLSKATADTIQYGYTMREPVRGGDSEENRYFSGVKGNETTGRFVTGRALRFIDVFGVGWMGGARGSPVRDPVERVKKSESSPRYR